MFKIRLSCRQIGLAVVHSILVKCIDRVTLYKKVFMLQFLVDNL